MCFVRPALPRIRIRRLRRILHKTTRTLLRLPPGGRFFCLSLLEQFSHCRFVIVISTFKNKSFHYILKSKTTTGYENVRGIDKADAEQRTGGGYAVPAFNIHNLETMQVV